MLSDEQKQFLDKLIEYDYIRMSFCDLNGHHMTKLISKDQAERLVKNQCDIYCGIIGFGPRFELYKHDKVRNFNFGNGYLVPDPETLHSLPWLTKLNVPYLPKTSPMRFCSVLCDFKWPDGQIMKEYPRTICKNLLQKLKDEYGLVLYSSFEPEFTMLKNKNIEDIHGNRHSEKKLIEPFHKGVELYKTYEVEKYEDFFVEVDQNMSHIGIKIQDFMTENGPGQIEMPLLPEFGIKSADNYFILKQSIKEIAKQNDMFATFMTKPFYDSETSTGCHYNHSLWLSDNQNENAFYDENDSQRLSELCRHWIGGLIEHLPAITALTSPTINCYRRLHRALAPDLCNWNIDDRFSSIRVKNFSKERTYIENRSPSSASCPYLVMAATLVAGMDGIRRKLEPKYFNSKDPAIVPKLPESFSASLKAMKEDEIFRKGIGEEFCQWLENLKTISDLKSINDHGDKNSEYEFSKELYEYLCFS